MGKKMKNLIKIYEYYYMDGFKVKEIEGEIVSKTVEYVGGEEYLSELEITPTYANYLNNMDVHTIHISKFNRLITTSECSMPIMFSLNKDDKTMKKFKNYCASFSTCEVRKYTQILDDAKQKLEYWDNLTKGVNGKNDKR